MTEYRVLFVCLGNICRSPTAEGVFRKLVADQDRLGDFEIDSAGTGSWHAGSPPDERSAAAALLRGIDLSGQRARQVTAGDFENFDIILAMDEENFKWLKSAAPEHLRDRIFLFLDFAPGSDVREVPDPYYGGMYGFDHVLDLVEEAAAGLLAHIDQGSP